MLQKNDIITFLNCFTKNPLNCRKGNPIEDTFLLKLKENYLRDLQSPLTLSIIRNLRTKQWIVEQKENDQHFTFLQQLKMWRKILDIESNYKCDKNTE